MRAAVVESMHRVARTMRRAHVRTGRALLLVAVAGSVVHAQQRPPATPPAQPRPADKRQVGVLPLSGSGRIEALGFALAEILARDLSVSPSLLVVERARIDAVLRELDFVRTGRVDTNTAPQAGKLVGAQHMFVGTIAASGANDAVVSLAVTDITTGARSQVFQERVPLTGIIDLQERMAIRAMSALRVTLTPAERDRIARRPTRSLEALVAFGNGRRLEAMGDPSQAARYYAQARAADPQFDLAELSPVSAVSFTDVTLPGNQWSSRVDPGEAMISTLVTTVMDQVVRPVGPGATCPPTCPAIPATLIVRIVR